MLASVLMRGLVRDGRLVRLRVTLPDTAGSLAKVATMIGDAGGNIVEVQHQRVFGTASVKSPEVEFVLETRGREHAAQIARHLAERGRRIDFYLVVLPLARGAGRWNTARQAPAR